MRRFAALVLLLAATSPAQRPEPVVVDGAVAVPFRTVGDVQLRLHLFRPGDWEASDRRPAVLFFFGGGWTGGAPTQFEKQARYLASRGLVAACAEYRVGRRHKTTPQDAVADAQAAVAWLAAHADEQGVDRTRLAAAGGSAGGHLAACTALAPPRESNTDNVRPAALVLFNPVLDTGPDGFGRDRIGEGWREISPLHQVRAGAPPTLVLHGTRDRTVPFAQAEAFGAAMKAVDARCEVIPYAGRGHGFFNPSPKGNDFTTTTRAMDRFLGSLGWLDGPPTLTEDGTTTWHGYTRRDSTLAGRALIVVSPDHPAAGKPWIWRARFFGHEPQADLDLLRRGFHLVYCDVADLYGNDTALAAWDATYAKVTTELGLAPRVALEGMSRGGLVIYRWAARNPDKVACLYADAPVCDIRSWPGGKGIGKGGGAAWQTCLDALGLTEATAATWHGNPIDVLAPLAAARIPVLHVCGDADDVVPFAENTAVLAERYRALGGSIEVIVKPGVGHHPHALRDPKPIVDFILRHALAGR